MGISPSRQAKIHVQRGEEALRRGFTGPAPGQDAEYSAAVDHFTEALRCLKAEDPMHADVSFLLGTARLAAHDKRCGQQCAAPAEFVAIVALIGVGGSRDGAPAEQLSLYAIVLDKLYDHTRDPADIDIAIHWLRRAAEDGRLSAADRRRMHISMAIQHTNRGEAIGASLGRSGPGTESWAAFDAALSEFTAVLAMAGRPGGWQDDSCATDRLDAWLGQLETYYQRGGGTVREEDSDTMAALARTLITKMVAGYHVRPYALGRAGLMLLQRLAPLANDSWDRALGTAVSSMRFDAVSAMVARVPGLETDLGLAIGGLTQAASLADPADRRQPMYTAALCMAHAVRYLAFLDDADLREVGRLGRAVLGHPLADPSQRRQCREWLALVLARRVAAADTGANGPRADWLKPSPSADGDLDTMLGLLAGLAAEDGAALAPPFSAILTDFTLNRAEGNLSNAELSAEYARAREAAAGQDVPALRAALLLRAAEIGAQLVYRGVASASMADEVAAAFREARRGWPAGHPLAREVAARAAAFKSARRGPRGMAPSGQDMPQRADGRVPRATAEELPPVLDVFSVRTLAALGVGTLGLLAGTPGETIEAATGLLAGQPHGSARRAAVLSVLALAQYATWLRERAGDGLGGSLDHIRGALGEVPGKHPLRSRLTLLLARMLLDRAQMGGDLADANAAVALLDGLRAPASQPPVPAGLGELLAEAGPPELKGLLAMPPARSSLPASTAGYRLDVEAAVGSGLLVRGILAGRAPGPLGNGSPDGVDGGADADLGDAVATLRRVAQSLPAGDPRRPDVLSDLGLALLAIGPQAADPSSAGTGPGRPEGDGREPAPVEVLRKAAAAAPPGHPRHASILLRIAAALAAVEGVAARTAAGAAHASPAVASTSHAVDEGISLITQALSTAGLTASGERSRCLYGLGAVLLIRFSRTGQAADLAQAIACLHEAREAVEAVPGDPFLVPLLRALAWAHRQDAYRLAREHEQPGEEGPARADAPPRLPLHRSRSTGRSLLYAHAQSVLLQSGSRHAVAAARAIGQDALTLTEWCIADGRPDSAVDALELGRALVLHAATVAADVPALLREAGHPELAAEWGGQAAPARGEPGGIDAIPGDLRGRVLAALRGDAADRRLLAAPAVADIASALRGAGLDALAYLIPASGPIRGRAVIVGADGSARECPLPGLAAGPGTPVARFASADHEFRATRRPEAEPADVTAARSFRDELGNICEWAWTAAIGPLLAQLAIGGPAGASEQPRPPRVAIVPIGILGCVPWHAARRTEGGEVRYACADVIFTTCASARQLIETMRQPRLLPGTGPAVFVANPTGDLPASQDEADAICAAFYSDAVYLGRSTQTPVSGAGSPDEVLAYLPGGGPGVVHPAVLHLGCHARAGDSPEMSRLTLAGGEVLPVSVILGQARHRDRSAPQGLVVLAACTSDLALASYDEALTLTSAFLATGATGAIGARWPVNDAFTAVLMFMLHRHLVRVPRDSPAAALRAAQLWMLDPHREVPPEMPRELASLMLPSASHPYAWAAFTYHGQ